MFLFNLRSFEAYTGVPEVVSFIFVFLFGAAVGSFLNVVIHRVPREQSVVFPNSACPACGTAIRPYDNLPIISWLLLLGKCRTCSAPISSRYPAVELLNAFLWLVVYWQFGFDAFLPVGLMFCSTMLALIFIDAEHMILPNVITYPLFLAGIAVRAIYPLLFSADYFADVKQWPLSGLDGLPLWLLSIFGGAIGGLVGGGFLWLVGEIWKRLRGVEAMGLGDVKMMAAVGMLLGWRLTMLAIFMGAFAGALLGSVMILKQKDRDLQSQIPFGIFLGIGSVVAMLFGERLISWYVTTFIP